MWDRSWSSVESKPVFRFSETSVNSFGASEEHATDIIIYFRGFQTDLRTFSSEVHTISNAFKIYKRDSLLKTFPLVSESFNIFLELPLKIISRKMKYKIIPISWINRKEGNSKFDIKELRAKYLFTLIYCLTEKLLLKK